MARKGRVTSLPAIVSRRRAAPYRNRSSSLDDSIQPSATDASFASHAVGSEPPDFPSNGTSFCYVAERSFGSRTRG